MKQYVIIGNGVAAAGCIEGIRSVDPSSPITVISEESRPVYCRPLISYYLEGKTDPTRMNYRPDEFYEQMGCRVLYGKRAEKITRKPKRVILDDGSELPYTYLCVATGSSPFIPPFQGLDTVPQKFRFMTLDDAEELKAALITDAAGGSEASPTADTDTSHKAAFRPDKRVLIVGAGLIGLKCAEGIHGLAEEITVCDLADRVLSSILDNECAGRMQRKLEEQGIRFLLGDSASRFEGTRAIMNSGKTVDFDILVLAVGVKANISLVKDLGGKTNRGILVNGRMETSVPGIYAAGDCAEGYDITLGATRVLAILPNAYMQGHTAGANMAGGEERFDKGIPMNSIGFFGLHAMTAGTYYTKEQGGDCFEEKSDKQLKRFFTKDGLLTGYILIGQTERAGIYTSLIREKTPLEQVDFEMLKRIATSAAFTPEARKKKFGTEV